MVEANREQSKKEPPRPPQDKLELPGAEQVAEQIKAALTAELAHVDGLDADVLRNLDPVEVSTWVSEDLTAALAEIAAGKSKEQS